jgi:hypothetical protein
MRRVFLNQERGAGDESIGLLQDPHLAQATQYSGWGIAANKRWLKSMANCSSSVVGLHWPAPKVPEGAVQFDGPGWNGPNGKHRQTVDEELKLEGKTTKLYGTKSKVGFEFPLRKRVCRGTSGKLCLLFWGMVTVLYICGSIPVSLSAP